jgi:hypothetical protein
MERDRDLNYLNLNIMSLFADSVRKHVSCPLCGVKIGKWCVESVSGISFSRRVHYLHNDRVDMYKVMYGPTKRKKSKAS